MLLVIIICVLLSHVPRHDGKICLRAIKADHIMHKYVNGSGREKNQSCEEYNIIATGKVLFKKIARAASR